MSCDIAYRRKPLYGVDPPHREHPNPALVLLVALADVAGRLPAADLDVTLGGRAEFRRFAHLFGHASDRT